MEEFGEGEHVTESTKPGKQLPRLPYTFGCTGFVCRVKGICVFVIQLCCVLRECSTNYIIIFNVPCSII